MGGKYLTASGKGRHGPGRSLAILMGELRQKEREEEEEILGWDSISLATSSKNESMIAKASYYSDSEDISYEFSSSDSEMSEVGQSVGASNGDTSRLVPLSDYVVIRLTGEINENFPKGTVLAVGPGSRNDKGDHLPPLVSVGDTVLVTLHGGEKIMFSNAELFLVREKYIVAKLEE